MSSSKVVARLVRKDLSLHWWLSAASLGGGILALGLLISGSDAGFYMGGVLMATALIAHGATMPILSVAEERQHQTLPFIMSLPVSKQQYAVAKILANLLSFGATWSVLLLGTLALVRISDQLANGLTAYVIVAFTEIFVSTCLILAVALVSRSLPWTIGTMILGNLLFNGFVFQMFRAPAALAAAQSPVVVWPAEARTLLLVELAGIAVLLATAYAVSIRRKDVL